MKFSRTIAVLALGASVVSALPKAQAPADDPAAVVELDPFDPIVDDPAVDAPVEDDPFAGEDPVADDPPVEDLQPIDDGTGAADGTDADLPVIDNPDDGLDLPIIEDPTDTGGLPTDTGDADGVQGDVIVDPIPEECTAGCPVGYVLGYYIEPGCGCVHYGWQAGVQIDSQNDNSVDNSQYPDNSVDNSHFLSPELNYTDTDNSRYKSPDVANGVGNGNGNGNGANATQNNDQNVAVAVSAVPAINIYNSDGSVNADAVKAAEAAAGGAVAGVAAGDHDWWPKNGTYTEIVSVLTTYCPEPTTIHQNGKDYPVTAAGTLTITDCPCTIVHVSLPLFKPLYPNLTSSQTPTAAAAAPVDTSASSAPAGDAVAVAGNSGASANAGGAAAPPASDVGASAGAALPPATVDTSNNAGTGTDASAPAQYTGAASLNMAVNWVLGAAVAVVALL
jgi:hypothetical protein